jgi:hypothetical protein
MSRVCSLCGQPLAAGVRADARYCSTRCRVAAHRNPGRVAVESAAEPTAAVTVKSLGWYVEGIIPADKRAEVERLHAELADRHGDFASEGFELEADGPIIVRLFVAIDRLSTAEEFAQAVNDIL